MRVSYVKGKLYGFEANILVTRTIRVISFPSATENCSENIGSISSSYSSLRASC
jgi:hypothetical protein